MLQLPTRLPALSNARVAGKFEFEFEFDLYCTAGQPHDSQEGEDGERVEPDQSSSSAIATAAARSRSLASAAEFGRRLLPASGVRWDLLEQDGGVTVSSRRWLARWNYGNFERKNERMNERQIIPVVKEGQLGQGENSEVVTHRYDRYPYRDLEIRPSKELML